MITINDQRAVNIITAAVKAFLIIISINIHTSPRYVTFDMEDTSMMIMLAYTGIFFWILNVDRHDADDIIKKPLLRAAVLLGCCMFSIAMLAGINYKGRFLLDPHDFLATAPCIVRTAGALAGGILLYWYIIISILIFYKYIKESGKLSFFRSNCIEKIIDGKYCLLKCALFITAVWVLQIIIRYPGIPVIDSWASLYQYWNPEKWSSQHPVIFTLVFGKIVDYSLSLGHIEWGFFMLTLAQTALTILSIAYTITMMKHFNVSEDLRFAALLFYAVLPLFPSFSTTIIIDSIYLPAFLLMITELIIAVFDTDFYLHKPYHIILTIIAIVGMFFRYNGFYILLVVIVGLLAWLIESVFRDRSKCIGIAVVICAFIIPTVLMNSYTGALTEKYVSRVVASRAKNSMIIQQIARCAREHPESFERSDKKALKKVMKVKLDKLAQRYDPYQFDSIKIYFNTKATREDMMGFYKVWLKMLKLHPRTCIEATLQQNYFLFSILAHNVRYYDDYVKWAKRGDRYDYSNLCNYEEPYIKSYLREQLTGYYKAFEHFPFIGLFTNQAIYIILLFALFLMVCFTRDWRKLIILLPLCATVGIIIIGPACYNHARYLYPVVYAMPVVFIEFALINRERDTGNLQTENTVSSADEA